MKELVRASAPSNIALIKYMGKIKEIDNQPCNASLSFTLNHLRTLVMISTEEGLIKDEWRAWPEAGDLDDPEYAGAFDGSSPVELSESGIRRFIAHFEFLKKSWRIPGHYILSSLNNFPADCGLASSASSFAALTRATAKLARLKGQVAESELSLPCLSEMSRRGSGSSCRSFYSPWSLWQRGGAEPLHNTELVLLHQVVVVESGKKSVSSSEAHRRVPSSALFKGRPERAEARLKSLIQVIAESDWRHGFEICWSEFWDMHALFETSFPSFGYMKPASLAVLELIRKEWEVNQDGPWVTMDAGANVHLLYREDQKNLAQNLKTSLQKFGKVLGL